MAALAGLGPLGHFDLDFLGGKQVIPRHAEAAGGHLLDGGIELGSEALGQLAALAAVGFPAQAVHGLGQTFMGFPGNGAIAHGPGAEAPDDPLRGLHRFQRNFPAGVQAERQHGADGAGALDFDPPGVLIKQLFVVGPDRLLQQVDGFRGIEMLLRPFSRAQSVEADAGQAGNAARKSGGVVVAAVCLHPIDVRAAQGIGRVGKVSFDELFVQPHRLEQLGALVGL